MLAPPWATAAAVGPGGEGGAEGEVWGEGGNLTFDKLFKNTEKTKMRENPQNTKIQVFFTLVFIPVTNKLK